MRPPRSLTQRRPRLSFVVLIALTGLLVAPSTLWARRDDVSNEDAALARAIKRLSSPLAHQRRLGALHIKSAFPRGRDQVIAALDGASRPAQREMAVLLIHEGSSDSIDAVIRHILSSDPVQSVALSLAVVRDKESHDQVMKQYVADRQVFHDQAKQRGLGSNAMQAMRTLVHLIDRAEIEALFLSRMSKSGGTGYYRGQYNVLKNHPNRRLALHVVTGIALDVALSVPGQFANGPYEFLRKHHVSIFELSNMAMNAVAELCRPQDVATIARIDERREEVYRKIRSEHRALRKMHYKMETTADYDRYLNRLYALSSTIGEYSDLVTCLYLIEPETYKRDVDDFLNSIRYDYQRVRPPRVETLRPVVLIRVGWYKKAVEAFMANLGGSSSSDVLTLYNMACAYASWSMEPKGQNPQDLRDSAIRMLRRSVTKGWRDLDWMQEDRDLDPIRSDPRYAKIVAKIKKALELPPK